MDTSKKTESPNRPMPRRIISSDGELLSLLGAAVRLKITSRETLGAYCVCEGRLPPALSCHCTTMPRLKPSSYSTELSKFCQRKNY